MMEDLFTGQMDYVFFFAGLAFFSLTFISLILFGKREKTLPWLWLGLAAVSQGITAWAGVYMQTFKLSPLITYTRLGLSLFALFCLVEFGRAGVKKAVNRGPGAWVNFPILLFTGLVWYFSGISGLEGINYAGRNVLGTVGGIWSALAFIAVGMQMDNRDRRLFFMGAVGMGVYALLSNSLIYEAPLFKASSLMHKENAYLILGLPIPLLRSLCAAITAWALVYWYSLKQTIELEHTDFNTVRKSYVVKAVVTLTMIVIAGAFLTEISGRYAENAARRNMLKLVQVAKAGIEPEVLEKLEASPGDVEKHEYQHLKHQLIETVKINDDCRFAYLIGLREGKVIIFVDSDRESSPDYSPPGSLHAEAGPEFVEGMIKAQPFIIGPYSDRGGIWVSSLSPVHSEEGREILAFLGMDMEVSGFWRQEISFYRLLTIAGTLMVFILTGVLFFAWLKNKESALRIAELQIKAFRLAHEKKLRDITNALGEGVYLVDEGGYITFANPAAEQLLGWTEAELLGKHLSELIYSGKSGRASIDKEDAVFNQVSKIGEAFCSEGDYFIRKDGTTFPVSCVISHFVEEGQVTGMVTAFQDITIRKQIEDDLRKKNDRMQKELKLANEVQQSLLPDEIPRVPGISLAIDSLVALEVGGDYCDIFCDKNEKLVIAIGDVMGKGVPAALFVTMAHCLVRTYSLEGNNPGKLVGLVNRSLYNQLNTNQEFLTLFYCLYDPVTGEMKYANAGHNLPIVYRAATGEIDTLQTKGCFIGGQSDLAYQEGMVRLNKGDIILFYTDGLNEGANDRHERFGIERIEKVIRNNHLKDPKAIKDALIQEFRNFSGVVTLKDDLTVVLLKKSF